MTKPRKKPASKPVNRDRVVYEVKGSHGVKQVDATSTSELKTVLAPLLGLDPYSTQAVAHIAHVERATVQGNGWSIRRLGVLAFVPDSAADTRPAQRSQSPRQEPEEQADDTQPQDDPAQEPVEEQPKTELAPRPKLQAQDTLL